MVESGPEIAALPCYLRRPRRRRRRCRRLRRLVGDEKRETGTNSGGSVRATRSARTSYIPGVDFPGHRPGFDVGAFARPRSLRV